MKGGEDKRLMRLTNFFIDSMRSLKREIEYGETDEVLIEGYNEKIEKTKKNIINYFINNPGLNKEKGKIYLDNVTKYFNDNYSGFDINTGEDGISNIDNEKVHKFLNFTGGKTKKKNKNKNKRKSKRKSKKTTKKSRKSRRKSRKHSKFSGGG